MNRKLVKWFSPLLALAIFLVALWALNRALGRYDFDDILHQLRQLSPAAVFTALVMSAASYLLLSLYDHLALRYVGQRVSTARVTLVSFSSYAFSHNVGFSLLTGGSIRYRMYSSWGLSADEVARLTAFAALCFVLGMTAVGSLLLLLSPVELPHLPFLPLKNLWPIPATGVAAIAGYLLLVHYRRQPLRLRGWQIPLPPLRYAIGQILLGSAEWTMTASVLYPLLPPGTGLSLPEFLQIYLLAQLVAMFSHVPGGLGVFETVFLLLVPEVPPPALFGSLLVFRSIYYLLPFGLAVLLLIAFEAVQQRQRARRAGAAVGQWIAASGPLLLAAGTLGAGAALLFSAVIPRHPAHLNAWLPVPLRETGHLLSAAAGAGLLLVARGLQLRLRSAWRSAAALLLSGGLFAWSGGNGAMAAAVAAVVLAALFASRDLFQRPLLLRDETFTPWWIALILIVQSTAVWLGLFSLQKNGISPVMMLTDLSGNAARILRAEAAAALVLLLFVGARLLRRSVFQPPSYTHDVAPAAALAAADRSSLAHLVLLGDKKVLFSTTGDAFSMYAEGGNVLVAVGDPVGAAEPGKELAWRFREICDAQGKWPVFFGVGSGSTAVCLEMGLALQPIGCEAIVGLAEFSSAEVDAGVAERCRQVAESGCSFEICAAIDVPAMLPELALVDRQANGNTAPSLIRSYFQPTFVSQFPLATARRSGEILGFASLPSASGGADLVLGLVRILPTAPPGLFDFLLMNLCRWAREAGVARLNLGLVPSVATSGDLLAATWERLGSHIFAHGDLFATLAELRARKEAFRPRRQPPLYLACPQALAMPEILADIAGVREGGGRQ